MLKRLTSLGIAAALFATACGGSSEETVSADDAASADAAVVEDAAGPTFLDATVASVDGGTLDLSTYAGSDLILWFWAPW